MALKGADSDDNVQLNVSLRQPVEKFYFLSVQRVSYGREAVLTPPFVTPGAASSVPTHRLVVQDLRAAWTKSNRQVVFALYDSWVKAQVLKKNLSAEVMKLLRMPESTVSPMKPRNSTRPGAEGSAAGQPTPSKPTVDPATADPMLQQLLADHRNVVFSEDLSSSTTATPSASSTRSVPGRHRSPLQNKKVFISTGLLNLSTVRCSLKAVKRRGTSSSAPPKLKSYSGSILPSGVIVV